MNGTPRWCIITDTLAILLPLKNTAADASRLTMGSYWWHFWLCQVVSCPAAQLTEIFTIVPIIETILAVADIKQGGTRHNRNNVSKMVFGMRKYLSLWAGKGICETSTIPSITFLTFL